MIGGAFIALTDQRLVSEMSDCTTYRLKKKKIENSEKLKKGFLGLLFAAALSALTYLC